MGTRVVFLCGFPSSGTDLLKNLINAHGDIVVGGEFPFLPYLAAKYDAVVSAHLVREAVNDLRRIDVYDNLKNLSGTELSCQEDVTFADLFARLLTSRHVTWVGNKTPQNSENVCALNHLFPNAKFVVIVRDVRDVALSWKKKWAKDSRLCAAKWNRRMLYCMHQLKSIGSDRYLLLKYESLLSDTESVARQICGFLDVAFKPQMLEYHKHIEHVMDGKLNYGKPIIGDNYGKWRKTMKKSLIRRIEEIAYDAMQCFGYDMKQATESVPLRRTEEFIGRMRDIRAMLFVGNRALKANKWAYRFRMIRLELIKRSAMPNRQVSKSDGL